MPSEFVTLPPLAGNISAYDFTDNPDRLSIEINADLRQLCANGVADGTLTLGSIVPDAIGMALVSQLITIGWTINSTCAIITQQTLFTVNIDGTWNIAILTFGSGTTYQWQWYDPNNDWTDYGGETSATFDNPPRNESNAIDPDTQRYYRCKVTRGGIDIFSDQVILPVPMISAAGQPASVVLSVGDPLELTCVGSAADGAGNPAVYSWIKDGVDTGITGDTFAIASVAVEDSGTYQCVITMVCGAKVTSNGAVVTIN